MMVQVALQTMSWSRDATLLPEHHRCIFRQGTNPTAPSSEVQHCLCIPYFHDAIIIIAGSLGIHGIPFVSLIILISKPILTCHIQGAYLNIEGNQQVLCLVSCSTTAYESAW